MLDLFMALFGLGFIGTLILAGGTIVLVVWDELSDDIWGPTVFATGCCIAVILIWGDYSLATTRWDWTYLIRWGLAGLLYIGVRCFFLGVDIKKYYQEWLTRPNGSGTNADRLQPVHDDNIAMHKRRALQVLRNQAYVWWVFWPISALVWITRDLLHRAWKWLYKRFRHVFEALIDFGFKVTP